MNIQLPNGQQQTLDENITIEEKKKVVNDLVDEWDSVISERWNSNSVKFFLDTLANYLVWHKEEKEKGKEDKFVLSRKKTEKLVRFKKTSKTINFTDLNNEIKEKLFGETRGAE